MTGISSFIAVSILDTYALTSVDNVRVQLGMPGTALNDTLIRKFERTINAASAHLEEYMRRRILVREYTENQDSRGGNYIITKEFPIQSVSEVWFDHSRAFTDPANQLPSTGYAVADDGVTIETLDRNLPHGRQVVRVKYQGGFPTVPHDISRACDLLVEWWYRFEQREDIGRSNKSKGDESTVIAQDTPPLIYGLCEPYRRLDLVGASPTSMAVT